MKNSQKNQSENKELKQKVKDEDSLTGTIDEMERIHELYEDEMKK